VTKPEEGRGPTSSKKRGNERQRSQTGPRDRIATHAAHTGKYSSLVRPLHHPKASALIVNRFAISGPFFSRRSASASSFCTARRKRPQPVAAECSVMRASRHWPQCPYAIARALSTFWPLCTQRNVRRSGEERLHFTRSPICAPAPTCAAVARGVAGARHRPARRPRGRVEQLSACSLLRCEILRRLEFAECGAGPADLIQLAEAALHLVDRMAVDGGDRAACHLLRVQAVVLVRADALDQAVACGTLQSMVICLLLREVTGMAPCHAPGGAVSKRQGTLLPIAALYCCRGLSAPDLLRLLPIAALYC
jgi:hypothetical protein